MSTNTYEKCRCGGSCGCGMTEKCTSGTFKRVNYFHGMLLTEEDFVDEQTYLREKLKLHNRLHGAGVIWGLELHLDSIEVSADKDTKPVTKVFVGGGLALDCAGNEIVVCEKYLVPLDEKIEELCRYGKLIRAEPNVPPTEPPPKLYIGIRYCECQSQPTEQYTSECADDRLRPQYARYREGFSVLVLTEAELPACQKTNMGKDNTHACPSCSGLYACREEDQLIILGYVENYDTTDVDYPDHKAANITNYDNYPTTPNGLTESAWAHPRWEAQRQNTLRTVFKDTDWVDVSTMIGRGRAAVEAWLTENNLTLGTTYVPGNIEDEREFFEKARNAERWAEEGSVVDLVTAGVGSDCIIFLLVSPPQLAQ
jgi:hypothetical protein